MAPAKTRFASLADRLSLEHSARTAVAAAVSLLVARAFKLPEAYWACITAIIVMQSNLGAALAVSGQRFVGTALGAAMGALVAPRFGPGVIAFGASILVLGLVCAALRVGRPAYRFAGIALAIVMLVGRALPPQVVALHRFIEVSVGIAVGLVVTAGWPERQA